MISKHFKFKWENSIKLSLILFTAIFVIIVSSLAKELYAQSNDFTISPPKFEESLSPGQTASNTIKIINNSDIELSMEAKVYDFEPSGEEGRQTFISPESGGAYIDYSLGTWVSIDTKPFVVGPKSTNEVNFSIEVPKSAEPGGHYAVIFFGPSSQGTDGKTETTLNEGQVNAKGEIGTLVLIRVEGEVNELATIAQFNSLKKIWERPPATLITRFDNLSNVHLKPVGFIDIFDIFGKKIDTLDVNKDGGNVLPKSIRKFETVWEKGGAFGRYTAKLSLAYGEKNQVLTEETIFWIIPWIKILIGIPILAILILAFVWGIKRYNRYIIGKSLKK